MKVIETPLPGVLIIEPAIYRDDRGAFFETYNERILGAAGLPAHWVQDNFSISRRNVIRGLHYQVEQTQGKLVRCAFGTVWDVAVDLRRGSPTFGKHFGAELSGENARMLWIPEGFGHGFAVLSEVAGFAYKVTDYYAPRGERTILWNDPQLAIPWPVAEKDAIVSEKDRHGKPLADAKAFA